MADHARVRALFDELRHLDAQQQQHALASMSAEDADLRKHVEALLHNAGEWKPLEQSPLGSASNLLNECDPAEDLSRVNIPGYRLVRLIGEGGMGLVYEAEQETPRRTVALKILHPGLATTSRLQRFRLESEVLARLSHSGIARIFEAGTYRSANREQPFFAMELIEGMSIIEFASDRSLDLAARINLIIQLCEAIDHAHQRGVIHRDLKPSNLLVDQSGTLKVLDFGVARSIEADTFLQTIGTSTGELVGTLAYMSPEQLAGDAPMIDTRADIYAIGAIAYELFSRQPLHDITGRSLPDAIIKVRDATHTSLGAVAPALRGDLSTIVMKALEHDPERRYPAASALAADLRRLLANEPIEARTPTAAYQLRKFTARNTGLVTAIAAIFAVLVLGLVASGFGLARAIRAEADASEKSVIATREAAIAHAVNEFLNEDLLSAINPSRAEDRNITMREVVNRASERIDGRFPDQPLVEASIRITLANVYQRLGESDVAETHWRRALALHTEHSGPTASVTLTTSGSLATILMEQSRFDEAVTLIESIIQTLLSLPEPEEAELLKARNNLAGAYLRLGSFEKAAPLLAETLERKRREFGEKHPSTLTSINNLAGLYLSIGEPEKAEPLYREAYNGRLEVLGEGDLGTINSQSALSWALTDLGKFEEAEKALLDCLAVIDQRLDADHPMRLRALNSLGNLYVSTNRHAEAEEQFQAALTMREQSLGPAHLETLQTKINLAEVVLHLQRADEAANLYREVLSTEAVGVSATHWHRAGALVGLGHSLAATGDLQGAESMMIQGVCHFITSLGPTNYRTERAIESLAQFYEDHGDSPRAIELREAQARGETPPDLCPSSDSG